MEQVFDSPIPNSGALKRIENGLRPKTMLSPDLKRSKTTSSISTPVIVDYPSVSIPSSSVIKELYDVSLQEECEAADKRISGGNKPYNDQQLLAPAGVLSFETVLLPAIGLAEEKALKQVQSKIQRDAPEYKFLAENCRRLVRESIRCAMKGVQSSRSVRNKCQEEKRRQRMEEEKLLREDRRRIRREEQKRIAKDLERRKEILRSEKRRNLARENLRNQELWKEIIFLTSSATQIEREEQMWVQIEKDMIRLESSDLQEQLGGNESSPSTSRTIIKKDQHDLQIKTEEKVNDIILTSNRIQKGLEMIMTLLNNSETVRKDLYDGYKKDHVFSGYQSVKNPKNLIRFLSQSQEV